MDLLSLLLIVAAPLSGGHDLLDLVPTDAYWEAAGVVVSPESMLAHLDEAGGAGDAAALIRDLGAAEFAVREAATQKLLALGPAVAPQLEQAAESDDLETATRAKRILRALGTTERVKSSRRLMAIRALGELKHEPAIPQLEQFARSDDPLVAHYAVRAVAAIGGRDLPAPPVTREQLEEDLYLLPEKCGLVGQWCAGRRIPLAVDQVLRSTGAFLGRGKSPEEIKTRLNARLVALADEFGMLRIDAITFGLADAIGPSSGFVIAVARGHYDKTALRTALTKRDVPLSTQDGIDVAAIGGEVVLLLLSDSHLVLLAGPNKEVLPTKSILAAVKSGQGGVAANQPLMKLVRAADREAPLWFVAQMSDNYKQNDQVFAAFDRATFSGRFHEDGQFAGRLEAFGSDAGAIRDAVARFENGLAEAKQAATQAAAFAPPLAMLGKSLETIRVNQPGETQATVSGVLEQPGLFLSLPLLAIEAIDQGR